MRNRAPRALTPEQRDLLKKQIDVRVRERLAQGVAPRTARPGGHVMTPKQAKS